MNTLDHNKFGENILQKIKTDNIAPKPKWIFKFKASLVWVLGIFSLLLGAIATSLIVYFSSNENLPMYRRAGGGLVKSLLLIIPVFWLICLGLFGALVFYYIRHTRKGYKYSWWYIGAIIVVFITFLAAMFSVSKLNEKIEEVISRHTPYYDTFINPGVNFWSNPEEGRLSGLIIQKISDNEYLLIDKRESSWTIINTLEISDDELSLGRPVRLIGEKINNERFIIHEVVPMGPGQGFLKRPGGSMPGCNFDQPRPCQKLQY